MIASSGNLLLSVVNDMLDFSRLESGNVDSVLEKSSLQDILNSVIFAMQIKAESNDVLLVP